MFSTCFRKSPQSNNFLTQQQFFCSFFLKWVCMSLKHEISLPYFACSGSNVGWSWVCLSELGPLGSWIFARFEPWIMWSEAAHNSCTLWVWVEESQHFSEGTLMARHGCHQRITRLTKAKESLTRCRLLGQCLNYKVCL